MIINKDWFLEKIDYFLSNDEINKFKVDKTLIFDPEVLIGFVSASDPIFNEYKEIIGNFHLTPIEAYTKFCEKNRISCTTENLSVVVYILSINQQTKKENLKYSKKMPSERWAHTRLFGEQANQKLQKYLITELKKENINAIAPITYEYMFRIIRKPSKGIWTSTWSHRHMAFAAGLGSFSITDGFISKKGIAVRCGSIVVNYKLPSDADERPEDPYYYCSNCGACIIRCPVGAITHENRHDKRKCSQHVFSTIPYAKKTYGIDIYSCGLCQVGVPCENGIPEKKNCS